MTPLLEVRNLCAGHGELEVLHGVSLDVAEGEVVAILGPNGAGKSTLLGVISGIYGSHAGEVRFAGASIDGLPPHRIAGLGLVQVPEGRHIFPYLTVLENLLVGATPAHAAPRWRESLEETWRLFPVLRERARSVARTLSGGQQQMLAVGRALMGQPRLVMLDEPSLGLGPMVVREMFAALDELRAGGLTVLLVEQDIYQALGFADRAYVLENGAIALAGPSETLRGNDHVRAAYLGL
jgi:branched-chain amino acid transport system ATP-binding protein